MIRRVLAGVLAIGFVWLVERACARRPGARRAQRVG